MAKKALQKSEKKEHVHGTGKYVEGVGRRKTAIARVRLYPGGRTVGRSKESFAVNGREYKEYFGMVRWQKSATAPLGISQLTEADKMSVEAKVRGGGVTAQAGAIRLGLARALVAFKPELRAELKSFGYLTRDARKVERKKYGLHKARRAHQWKKR